ncbi:hypothetical protein WMF18_11490 [Sorangium sp. So ce315]|uniref:hypothetical protein n=1 Tax=Sorangium sp. So ce315 TaxID=3133299 RepID=UPI003F63A8A4
MPYEAIGVSVRSGVAMLCVVAAVQLVLLPNAAASLRQRMFDLRRRLFRFMADGHVQPDDPAYVQLRDSMNGIIRHAERASFLRLMFVGVFLGQPGMERKQRFEAAVMALPTEHAREHLTEYRRLMETALIWHVIVNSPVAWLLVLLLLLSVIVTVLGRAVVGAPAGFIKTVRRLLIQKLRKRLPAESIAEEAELFDNHMIASV